MDINEKLLDCYILWAKQVKEKIALLSDAEKYSAPYYSAVQDDWECNGDRLLFVGEEGYGNGYCDIPNKYERDGISYIQEEWKLYVKNETLSQSDNRWFWRRFLRLNSLCKATPMWSNLDKITHVPSNGRGRYRLNSNERTIIHSTDIRILQKEIEITKPRIVLFNGWYGTSIKAELPEVYEKFYSEQAIKEWDENRICTVEHENIRYVLAYHPSFRTSVLKGRFDGKKAKYEEAIFNMIKDYLN